MDGLTLLASYTYAALAEPGDRWTSGAMTVVGAAPGNRHRGLGHEVDRRGEANALAGS